VVSSTGTTAWHADEDLIDRYLGGRLDIGLSASLEAHLLKCDRCRDRLAVRVPPRIAMRIERAWPAIREGVEVPPLPWAVRLLRRLGMSRATAVLLAAARSMSTAWTLATVIVLVFAALAAFTDTDAGRAVYLIVAPLVPVAGVVAAFGPTNDPLAELTGATPYPAARLVLVRAGGVAATSFPLAVGVGLLIPGTAWLAFAWLVPALAFIFVVLSASTWIDPMIAGGVVALGWAAVVGSATRVADPLDAVAGAVQPAYLALAALAALVLLFRIRLSNAPGGIA
jgi:hypothetical protein